jgi:hypothetical protein
MRAFERDVVELLFIQKHIGVGIDLVALDAAFLGYLRAGLRIDHVIADPVAGFAVDDIEANPVTGARRGEEGNCTRHQGGFEIALPIRTRCHDATRFPW